MEAERLNPQYAALPQEQLGSGNGELRVAMQYMSQSFMSLDMPFFDRIDFFVAAGRLIR